MITHSDDGPDFDPDDPLTVILRPTVDYLGPPPGRYEAIRRGATRRWLLRTAVGVGLSCAVAAFVALPLHLATREGPASPTSPTLPLAPPASGPSADSGPTPTSTPRTTGSPSATSEAPATTTPTAVPTQSASSGSVNPRPTGRTRTDPPATTIGSAVPTPTPGASVSRSVAVRTAERGLSSRPSSGQ